MRPRPSFDAIQILRHTLHQMENDADPRFDASALAELKRVVIHRIAELETQKALDDQTIAAASAVAPELQSEPAPDKAAA